MVNVFYSIEKWKKETLPLRKDGTIATIRFTPFPSCHEMKEMKKEIELLGCVQTFYSYDSIWRIPSISCDLRIINHSM